jgi:hypothetical protein
MSYYVVCGKTSKKSIGDEYYFVKKTKNNLKCLKIMDKYKGEWIKSEFYFVWYSKCIYRNKQVWAFTKMCDDIGVCSHIDIYDYNLNYKKLSAMDSEGDVYDFFKHEFRGNML